jgi:KDO2-lipid IV(A) lauroyltransferase
VLGNLRVLAGGSAPRWTPDVVFRNYGRFLFEFLRGPDVPEIELAWEGRDVLDRALDRGRGVVLACLHTGNWEMAGTRLAQTGVRVNAVAGVQLTRGWTRELRRRQEAAGIRILPTTRDALRSMRERLARNEAISLLVDGDRYRGAITVPFGGRPAPLPIGPAKLAARTGAALVPCYCRRQADGSLRFRFLPEIPVASAEEADVRRATARLAGALGEVVREHGDQWLIFRRFFERGSIAAGPVATDPVASGAEAAA